MHRKHVPYTFLALIAVSIIISSCSADVEQWRVIEIPFESQTDYDPTGADQVLMDVTFTHWEKSLTVPAFWDGGKSFKVRFAPTVTGVWSWTTTCPQDASLDGVKGSLRCGAYKGDLDIYKHGFIQAEAGRKYMTYADGTPFFYLGDTHWGMYREEIDEPGPNAGQTGAASHFCYIVDRRAEQGFTVYQSEPIDAAFDLTDGKVDASDIAGLQLADRYYRHIADAGLVHANAEFFYASKMRPSFTDAQLETLSRYWVARFGAYPVLWTLAQEIDNDFYYERGDQRLYDFSCNPWVKVAEYIHRHDAYGHPLSAHQENVGHTTITGRGTKPDKSLISGDGVSVFADEEVAQRTGHNWWATQWSPRLNTTQGRDIPADYYESQYPAVNYEGRYCYLWTKDFGARAQGWISFLSGFCGYGYGAIDMWLYKSTYNIDVPSSDGIDTISVKDKQIPWSTALEFESANQMRHLRSFMESFDWWNLLPVLNGDESFVPAEDAAWACARTIDRTVLYFYGNTTATGKLTCLKPYGKVSLGWFDPRSGEASTLSVATVDINGCLELPEKPSSDDWVLDIGNLD